jgi:hypothetical protein
MLAEEILSPLSIKQDSGIAGLTPVAVHRFAFGCFLVMRLYLDSKDIIGVLARGNPVDAGELSEVLQAKDTELVFSWSNIIESVTFREPNIRETRRRLELLEQIPQCYILGLPPLIRTEFRSAYQSFEAHDNCFARIDPFVPTWLRALTVPGRLLPQDLYINYTTTDQVLDIVFNNPQIGQVTEAEHTHYRDEVAADRVHNAALRRSPAWFRGGIAQTLFRSGIRLDRVTFERFADWLAENPTACSGWLLFQESYGVFCDNIDDAGKRGDAPDYSHVITAPYVDAITLDRRMADYCRRASRTLANEYDPVMFAPMKIYRNLEEWIG